MDLHVIAAIISKIDLKSAGLGAAGAALLLQGARKIPGFIVNRIKARFVAASNSGKLDAATASLLTEVAKSVLKWADDELPDAPGEAKMNAILNRLAQVPFIGFVVKADRDLVRTLLQEEYDAWKAEIHDDNQEHRIPPEKPNPAADNIIP